METTEITTADMHRAAQQMAQSGRGRRCMKGLLDWLDDEALGLDEWNKDAALLLLAAAFGPRPMTVRDYMREALGADA